MAACPPPPSLNCNISGFPVHTNRSNCHRKIQIWFANKPLPGHRQAAAARGWVPREWDESHSIARKNTLNCPEGNPRVPRHQISGGSGRGDSSSRYVQEGAAQGGRLRAGAPLSTRLGGFPPFAGGGRICKTRPATPPGRARPRDPPNSPHPAGLLRSAPRPLPYLPPPSTAPGLTGDEPTPVPLGAGRSAPKKALEEGFLHYFFFLIFSSSPRSQKAL